MDAENALPDHRCDGEPLEQLVEVFPETGAVVATALVVEPVVPVHAGRLVVPAEQEEAVRVLRLVAEEEAYRVHAELPPVNVIAEEQVARGRRVAAVVENAQQIEELTVQIAAHDNGRREIEKHRL